MNQQQQDFDLLRFLLIQRAMLNDEPKKGNVLNFYYYRRKLRGK